MSMFQPHPGCHPIHHGQKHHGPATLVETRVQRKTPLLTLRPIQPQDADLLAQLVDGLAPERVRPVLEVALARFQHEESLRRELADARSQLSERKTVDRAKGYLMKSHGLSESDAYARLRKTAMDKGLKISEVAQRILDVADLLG